MPSCAETALDLVRGHRWCGAYRVSAALASLMWGSSRTRTQQRGTRALVFNREDGAGVSRLGASHAAAPAHL